MSRALLAVLLLAVVVFAQGLDEFISKGDDLFVDEQYEEALQEYDRAIA
ncbi:hypothetical protein KKC97_01395 [bacterium]|nr:hypothetical protein [bacterium]MBU1636305.1 hypothetical protein [bacterium]